MDELKKKLLGSSFRVQWEKIGIYSHHGIDLPISALRTEKSCGIGEFYDLLPLIDWCQEIGFDIIMLLPLNETSFSDPSPYNAISSCALHPLLLSLDKLPFLNSHPHLKEKLGEFKYLNECDRINYKEVYQKKFCWLKEYFLEVKQPLEIDPLFLSFLENFQGWLEPYSLFKTLKNKMNQQCWYEWPDHFKSPSRREYETFVNENKEEILFHSALQYFCFDQLKSVKNYANLKGIFLKGDIPILINPDSVDVWANPHLFDLSMAAGAPPDSFNLEGQYWGSPPFNWKAMRRFTENFGWWKRRLSYADHFYDLFRIDHIVGFFRLWVIPIDHHPKEGRYIPENASEWIPQGQEVLEFITNSSEMLPIGEDLGSVPVEVKQCLEALGICGTKIVRWERSDGKFIPFSEYLSLSMTSFSTHDIEPLRLWWKNTPHEAEKFADFKHWEYNPHLTYDQQKEILRDIHHTTSLFHINLLQDYLSLYPELIWPELEKERINVPGTSNDFNWTCRYRRSVQEIITHQGLRESIKEIIGKS